MGVVRPSHIISKVLLRLERDYGIDVYDFCKQAETDDEYDLTSDDVYYIIRWFHNYKLRMLRR